MTQDKESGAKASHWGHATAQKIAARIGATIPKGKSNECLYEGKRVVIKCAALQTDSVGITYLMMNRVSDVVGAFQLEDGAFDLWVLPVSFVKASMRPTASKGAAAGKVGIVKRDVFLKNGKNLQRVNL